jgi:hypothetical protein
VQLGELYKDSQAELFLQPIEGLQPYGTEKYAKMIVTAAAGTVLRPDGEDSLMFRTDHKVVYEKTTDATNATLDHSPPTIRSRENKDPFFLPQG